jgi:nitroimidazol reductase NimA-like FMN-containing flavoprotein (pyridoxamine 5'-phosphate oxidase superfamily)
VPEQQQKEGSCMPNNRKATPQQAEEFLKEGTYGVLSLALLEGTPYGVPLNYVYVPEDGAIYFHCARQGKKIDMIRQNPKASFAVVSQQSIREERFITHYDSAVVTGTVSLVEDESEKRAALLRLCARLTPSSLSQSGAVIERNLSAVAILRLSIGSVTGKRNRDD